MHRITILKGPQGCGKTREAKRMAKDYKAPLFGDVDTLYGYEIPSDHDLVVVDDVLEGERHDLYEWICYNEIHFDMVICLQG